MDGLITILILIGVFALKSSGKKKKAQQQAAKKRAFEEAGEILQQEKIPFSKDEWTAYLKQQAQPKAEAKPKAEARPKASKARTEKPKPTAVKPQPVLAVLEHDDPEGTISTQGTHSTQGESAAEHAEHRRKVLAEEARRQEENANLKELREMNLKKLRSAVVMSEVLGKPVSLRPRGYR